MNIINTNIEKINFSDIESFCDEQQIEGVQLEYKKEFPKKGLAKQIASFSNTRGGLLIIGIEEDEKIGIPKSYDGVINDGKLLERVHQYASQVEPIPSYQATATDEKNGKVFILIRVFEGEHTPYFVQNDSNIWVRTGNISNPIDHASPDALELLYKKREKAEQQRKIQIERTVEISKAAIERQEKKRIVAVSQGEESDRLRIIDKEVGSNVSMCNVTLQPYFPNKNFIDPYQLKQSLEKLITSNYSYTFPEAYQVETIPYGTLSCHWRSNDGFVQIEQIFGNGLISNARDLAFIDENGNRSIYLAWIAITTLSTLQAAANYYKLVGYQGIIIGNISFENIKGSFVRPIKPDGWSLHFFEYHTCLLDSYKWEINTDTFILGNKKSLDSLIRDIMDEIYVSFNYSPPGEKLYNAFFK
ncbi:MAG: ATP-binding protein [Ignavibacteriales bacterium]|nr:ATP-binding protein [Ignavibacteriales bacterium]